MSKANNILGINLKVLIFDTDYYALQSINSYLAWDRRTRVTCLAETETAMWSYLDKTPLAELPDVVVIDPDHIGGPNALSKLIERMRKRVGKVMVICLAQQAETELVEAAARAGARGYMLKGEVRSQIAWSIVFALNHDFVVSAGIHKLQIFNSRIFHAKPLPPRREYPELTDRVRQAIELCVVNGMPAHVAADEMGISLHTIRSYIKEGYRILEAYDETEYPVDMSPQERAFMRLTRFKEEK